MGDINIDLLKTTTQSKKYKRFMSENLLNVTCSEATRITNTTKTLLDHILVNNTDFYRISGTMDPGLSDHKLVYVTRKRLKPKGDTSYFMGQSYRNFDEALFYHNVSTINWLPLYMISNIDVCTEYFTDTLRGIINIHAPYEKIKCRSNQPKWVTGDFLSLIDEKEHLCIFTIKIHLSLMLHARERRSDE